MIEVLKQWRSLIEAGPPRPIDLVIFTDGFTPDPREDDQRPDRIGAVLFDRRLNAPVQFTAMVPRALKAEWLERKTQIAPVEMLAPIVALHTFSDRARNADLIL